MPFERKRQQNKSFSAGDENEGIGKRKNENSLNQKFIIFLTFSKDLSAKIFTKKNIYKGMTA